jgi:hypothetical protein
MKELIESIARAIGDHPEFVRVRAVEGIQATDSSERSGEGHRPRRADRASDPHPARIVWNETSPPIHA